MSSHGTGKTAAASRNVSVDISCVDVHMWECWCVGVDMWEC